ncbi:hypothetical protein T492DRAFT_832054 [Pavlovales sp. CCMP2436]|nr:hypothetical protein T492DRAFT_832054 [Pavlovales sp. CCMP2436]
MRLFLLSLRIPRERRALLAVFGRRRACALVASLLDGADALAEAVGVTEARALALRGPRANIVISLASLLMTLAQSEADTAANSASPAAANTHAGNSPDDELGGGLSSGLGGGQGDGAGGGSGDGAGGEGDSGEEGEEGGVYDPSAASGGRSSIFFPGGKNSKRSHVSSNYNSPLSANDLKTLIRLVSIRIGALPATTYAACALWHYARRGIAHDFIALI